MLGLCAFVLPALLMGSPQLAAEATKPVIQVTIPDGTEIRLRLRETVSSATTEVDEKIYFEAVDDLVINDITIIAAGANAWGLVTDVSKKGLAGRAGKIDFSIEYVEAVDGQKIRLKKLKEREGESKGDKSIGLAIVVHPLFLLKKGKDVKLKAGTEYTIYVDGERHLKLGPPRER